MDFSEVFLGRYAPSGPVPAPYDWSELEARFGSALPDDYKALTGRLGAFAIDEFIGVLDPVSVVQLSVSGQEVLRAAHPGATGVPVWQEVGGGPDPGGLEMDRIPYEELVKVGSTDTGERIHWQKAGPHPNGWPLLVGSDGPWCRYHMTLSEFLIRAIDRDIELAWVTDDDWPGDEVDVAPW
ncbi:hypothetical protein DFP74_6180 [Nocardiopsis sp. Huas11]|uniref:hypothetical protein n=1 Tax=Nocardiopsis sp. Huas11 TaxID=2183912 RepID=UPI000EB43E88|nr:hypothetical protein [Nocardiopsis sp. Huas11]RKS10414.1 hypothetical protein DFP74_6180 [Nocardiopsis sp. Huas11]